MGAGIIESVMAVFLSDTCRRATSLFRRKQDYGILQRLSVQRDDSGDGPQRRGIACLTSVPKQDAYYSTPEPADKGSC